MKFLSTIMLAAALIQLAPAFAQQAQKKAVASPAVQQEFDGFIAKFRVALKANDAAAVAGMTQLPFNVGDDALDARDVSEFRAKTYPSTFAAENRRCLQRSKAIYDRDQENNDNYFISCGESIFIFTKTPSGFLFTGISAND